ncbi:MAG: hypothetical protein FWD28_09815 [Treponema sp.]|nr:hypothetical protein [Treponema sp.]
MNKRAILIALFLLLAVSVLIFAQSASSRGVTVSFRGNGEWIVTNNNNQRYYVNWVYENTDGTQGRGSVIVAARSNERALLSTKPVRRVVSIDTGPSSW